jgi:hypothetical protein
MVPYLLKTDDNPDGVPLEEIQQFDRQIRDDRRGFWQHSANIFTVLILLTVP